MKNYNNEKLILPEFPRTQHLPIEPNSFRDDLIASTKELEFLLTAPFVTVEEKIDGSNCGITVIKNQPVIRNRKHILNKSYVASKSTPAKAQFVPIWTWYYANKDKFTKLAKILGYMPGVYGEWVYATHTLHYDAIPDFFIAYDLYEPQKGYLDSSISRSALAEAGFSVVPLVTQNSPLTIETLRAYRDGVSSFYNGRREGVYIKMSDGAYIKYRYKMVGHNFQQKEDWNTSVLVPNTLSS